jgi:histidinol-phosphate aminotransferase
LSKFFSKRHAGLKPYVPGEQPRGGYIKLNTNEAPYPPAPAVLYALHPGAAARLNLYPDPDGAALRAKLAAYHGVERGNIVLGNGSDETLAFIFLAFFDGERGVASPDVTYGLYPVLASLYNIPYTHMPVGGALEIRAEDYINIGRNIVLANPNAQTGIALPIGDIERIAGDNPDHVVVIDEAYADFAGISAIPLTRRYENLIVVRTYSKSRFMAGARLSYAVGDGALIADIDTVRRSFNPYNINSVTLAAGEAAMDSYDYYAERWKRITDTRERSAGAMRALGFTLTDSAANFLFARHNGIPGADIFGRLREAGILVRRFDEPGRISDWLRITVGTDRQMDTLIGALESIVKRGDAYAKK